MRFLSMTNSIFTSKKIIAVVLCCTLILSNLLVVFADDDNSGLSLDPELSSSELEFLSAATSDEDLQIRKLSVDVVRATSSTYTLDDVYALLIALITTQHNGMYEWKVYDNTIYNQINNNFSHYDSTSGNTYDTGSMLWTIRQAIMDLHANLTSAMGDTIYDLILNIDSMLSSFFQSFQNYDYTSALFYNSIGCAEYLSQIKSCLIDSNGLSIAQRVNALVQIDNNFANNMNLKVGSIDTKLTNTNNNLNTINNTASNIKSSVDSVNTSLQSFNNDLNNINWVDSSSGVSFLNSNFDNVSNSGSISNLYIKFYITNNQNNIYRFYIPAATSSNNFFEYYLNNIKVGYLTANNQFIEFTNYFTYYTDLTPSYIGFYLYVYFSNANSYGNGNITIYLNTPTYFYNYASQSNIKKCVSLSNDSSDFYTVMNYLINIKQYYLNKEHFELWKDIYASDDLIESKEDQQSYEDQVLDDFVGSGSAASSVNDVVSVKQISNTVSSGLDTGVGVSSVLSIFSAPHDDGDMFEWFTQSNYNQINNLYVYTPIRSEQTRSGSGSDFLPDIFSWSVEETINNPNSRND